MAQSSSSLDTPLADHLRNLAAFEPQDAPVVSLYLNLAPDQHGRDNYEAFCARHSPINCVPSRSIRPSTPA